MLRPPRPPPPPGSCRACRAPPRPPRPPPGVPRPPAAAGALAGRLSCPRTWPAWRRSRHRRRIALLRAVVVRVAVAQEVLVVLALGAPEPRTRRPRRRPRSRIRLLRDSDSDSFSPTSAPPLKGVAFFGGSRLGHERLLGVVVVVVVVVVVGVGVGVVILVLILVFVVVVVFVLVFVLVRSSVRGRGAAAAVASFRPRRWFSSSSSDSESSSSPESSSSSRYWKSPSSSSELTSRSLKSSSMRPVSTAAGAVVPHRHRLAGGEGKARDERELVARAHGQRADGELGGLAGLQEHRDALARLGLQAERGLAQHDGVALIGGELLRLLAAEARWIDLAVRSRRGGDAGARARGNGRADGASRAARTWPLGISMPKNCGMADAELAARGRMRRGTRESRLIRTAALALARCR